MSKGWDNATLKKLKALTGKGLSTSEIGKRLGLSKNAVVGKLNRLGWNLKAASAEPAAAAKKTAAPAKKAAAPKKAPSPKKVAPVKPMKPVKPAKKAAAPKKTAATPAAKTPAPKAEAKKVAGTPAKKNTDSKSLNKTLAMHQRIIQHSLEMAGLKPNQCRWPIGDPDSEDFHFCGEAVFVGKPYCYEHCKQAYQFAQKKQQ